MLPDDKRSQLDGIVQQMTSNGEPDANIQAVVGDFKQKYSQAPGQAPSPQAQQPDNQGAWFPASPSDTPVEAGLKTVGNLVPSAINTGVGMVKSVVGLPGQMLDTLKTANDTGNLYNENERLYQKNITDTQNLIAQKKTRGFDTSVDEKVLKNLQDNPPPERGLETLKSVPGAALTTLEGIFPFLKPAFQGDISGTAQTIENNPVGNILPVVTALEGGARGIDNMTGATDLNVATNAARSSGATPAELQEVPTPKGLAPKIDTAVSGTAQAVIKPVKALATAVSDKVGATARFGVSQATGLDPSTVEVVKNTPKSEMQGDRVSVARQVENGLQGRIDELSETGKGYSDIRKSTAPVRVDQGFLTDLFTKNTGLSIQEAPIKAPAAAEPGVIQMEAQPEAPKTPGKLVSGPDAAVRDQGDVNRLQKIYNTYQPLFEAGQMTPNQFLNLRSDLADAANYESKNGRSAPVEAAADRMRGQLNGAYRNQIPGLDAVDGSFSGQIEELKALRKGLLDKDGNLTDTAINKIANATGRGKDLLLGRLEQVVPGITRKIQIVKAIEDIQNTGGPKVGTYMRGGIEGGGALGVIMGHPIAGIAAIVAAILTSPKMAVPILRAYGASAEITAGVLSQLKHYLNPSLTSPMQIPFTPRQMTR